MGKNLTKKLISVVLPAYNCEKTIDAAVNSILNQTYENFELIIIDDGSTDNTYELLQKYTDNRIRLFRNQCNEGIIYTLNKGLSLANGEYIARMDADDISFPNRLSCQLKYINRHRLDAVGSGRIIFGEGIKNHKQFFPHTCKKVKAYLYLANPIVHPTLFIKHDFLINNNIKYSSDYLHVEDYKLCFDMCRIGRIGNIPEALLKYRVSKSQISTSQFLEQQEKTKALRREEFVRILAPQNRSSIGERSESEICFMLLNADSGSIDRDIISAISLSLLITNCKKKIWGIQIVYRLLLKLNVVDFFRYFLNVFKIKDYSLISLS